MPKNFYSISDVMELLDVSRSTAHKRIVAMNKELSEQGYYIERGKVPVPLFHEKYPYIKQEVTQ